MDNRTAQIGILTLGIVGALAVICIAVLILVLDNPDIAALAVLASIASAESWPLVAIRQASVAIRRQRASGRRLSFWEQMRSAPIARSIASAAVGGVAGMVTPRQQAPPPGTPARETPVRPSPTESPPTTPPRRPDSG